MEQAVTNVSTSIGEREACKLMGVYRGNVQRRRAARAVTAIIGSSDDIEGARIPANDRRQVQQYLERHAAKLVRKSSRSLSPKQTQELLDAAHQERFIDRSVPYIYATLLDENLYFGSISTMYRVLHRVGGVGERRDQATRLAHVKPELCASEPNHVYAWDITKLHGPQKWTYYYLYIVIDIYSRYVVGWLVADRESSELAKLLLETTIRQQGADPTKLTIHSDRGSSMTSKPVAFMFADQPLARALPHRKVITRYSRPIPGDRVQMDTCKIAPGIYQYTAVDDCSRYRVLAMYRRRTAANTLTCAAVMFHGRLTRIACPASAPAPIARST